jgi:hypothetical protein
MQEGQTFSATVENIDINIYIHVYYLSIRANNHKKKKFLLIFPHSPQQRYE